MSDDNAPEDGKQPARCKMNFACSIAPAQNLAGLGPSLSIAASLHAQRIVAARSVLPFFVHLQSLR